MLPLAGSSLPNSASSLVESLRGGFAANGITATDVQASGTWPQLDRLHLDLTGTPVDVVQTLPRAGRERLGTFSANDLSLQATPARLRSAAIELRVSARAATFAIAPAADASVVLLTGAEQGEVTVEITQAALEQLVHDFATAAAGEHGVEIKKTQITLASRGPRAVSIIAEVTAKAFIATATVKITGDADLDDHLVARLSNLQFHCTGMIANLAGGVIRPQLARLEGKTLPLMSFALGEISLCDLRVETGETIRLKAQFGR